MYLVSRQAPLRSENRLALADRPKIRTSGSLSRCVRARLHHDHSRPQRLTVRRRSAAAGMGPSRGPQEGLLSIVCSRPSV